MNRKTFINMFFLIGLLILVFTVFSQVYAATNANDSIDSFLSDFKSYVVPGGAKVNTPAPATLPTVSPVKPIVNTSPVNNVTQQNVVKISDAMILSSLRSVIERGLPEDIKKALQGPAGPVGPAGPQGASSTTFFAPPPASPNPSGPIGIMGGFATVGTQELSTKTLAISSNITQSGGSNSLKSTAVTGTFQVTSGNTTLESLSVTGTSTLSGNVSSAGTLISTGQVVITRSPTEAHVFAPAWPSGTSNISDASLYINPSSATADANLFGLAVNGSPKFIVDAEGDIYGTNLILTGSTSTGATTIAGNLTVQDSTNLGDAGADVLTISGTAVTIPNNLNFDANTLFIDSSNNRVGVGINNPGRHFVVSGSDAVQAEFSNTSTDGSVVFITKTDATDQSWGVGVAASSHASSIPDRSFYIRDETNALNRFVIDTSGNVGIGTINPGTLLDVRGDISDGATTGSFYLNNVAGNASTPTFTFQGQTNLGMFRPASDSLGFSTNGGERIRIDSTGNVGIGDTTPDYFLDVAGSVGIDTDLTVGDQLIVSGTGPHAIGGATHAAVQMYQRGSFTSTTSDAYGLLVEPNLTVSAANGNIYGMQIAPTINEFSSGTHTLLAGLRLDAPTINTGASTVTNAATLYIGAAPSATVSGGNYALWVDAGEARFDGSVGIGTTTTPAQKLEVSGTGNTAIKITSTDGGASFPLLQLSQAGAVWNIENGRDGDGALGFYSGGQKYKLSTTQMTLDGPDLRVQSAAADLPLISVSDTTNSQTWNIENGRDAVGNLGFYNSGTKMVLSSSGSLGIGTTSPTSRFHVQSASGSSSNSYFTTADFNGTNTGSGMLIDFGASSGNTYTRLQAFSNGSALTNNLALNPSGGNVGVGLTSPNRKLHVQSAAPIFTIERTDATTAALLIEPASGANKIYSRSTDTTAGSIPLHFLTADTERLTILGGGNVGVGTTNPGALLDVRGSAIFNEDGSDVDFRIESDTNANLFTIDAGQNNIGFGAAPNSRYFADFGGAGANAFTSGATLTSDSAYALFRPASVANTSGTGNIANVIISGGTSLNPAGASTWGAGLIVGGPSEGGAGSFTNMASLLIEDAPSAGSNNYSLYSAGSAKSYFAGNVGIGTTTIDSKLSIADSGATFDGTPGGLINLAQDSVGAEQGIISISTDDSANSTDWFIVMKSEQDTAEDNEFVFRTDGTALADGAFTGGGADVAEWTPTLENNLEPGDVLAVDGSALNALAKKYVPGQDQKVLGVVSTNPGLITGGNSAEDAHEGDVLVALVGRVPVKVSEENGPILAGDHLTMSTTLSGYAMKMTDAGQSLGIAFENSAGKNKILAFVKLSFWTPNNYFVDFNQRIDGLDLRIADLETLQNTVSFSENISLLDTVINSISNGVANMKALVLESLTIGSSQKRTGITLYDEVTGDPYCISIANGSEKIVNGSCIVVDITTPPPVTPPADTTPPVITLNGDSIINITLGSVYEELGATATDDVDGSVPVVITGSVDINILGSYTIHYNTTDSTNNNAVEVTRTVNVIE